MEHVQLTNDRVNKLQTGGEFLLSIMAAHVRHIGGQLQSGYEPDPDAYPTEDVRMVPVDQACYYGDTSRLQKLCMDCGRPCLTKTVYGLHKAVRCKNYLWIAEGRVLQKLFWIA